MHTSRDCPRSAGSPGPVNIRACDNVVEPNHPPTVRDSLTAVDVCVVRPPPGSTTRWNRRSTVLEPKTTTPDTTFDGGRGARDLVADADVSAVICFNDLQAVELMTALIAGGVRVPGEISGVGWGDVPVATMFTPALATVAAPLTDLGRHAMARLLARLDIGITAPPRELAPRLVVRETTAALPGAPAGRR